MVLIDVDVPLWRRRLRRRRCRCRRRRPCPRRVWCRVNSFPRLRFRVHDCSGSSTHITVCDPVLFCFVSLRRRH